jgi:pyruvate kinase
VLAVYPRPFDVADPLTAWRSAELDVAVEQLERLHAEMLRSEADVAAALREVAPRFRASARNLAHYLSLRRADLRSLRVVLARHGLSPLRRLESHAGSALQVVLRALYALRHEPARVEWLDALPDLADAGPLLSRHTTALLGPAPRGRSTYVVVTAPSHCADDYALVRQLLQRGMDCLRIECAHDDEAAWGRMVDHLERARAELGRPCATQIDLAGPQIRTGPIEPGPAVLKVKPWRDPLGAVVRPAVLAFVPRGGVAGAPRGVDAIVPVDRLPAAAGERLTFEDARGRRRTLRVRSQAAHVVVAELDRTAYLLPGTRIHGSDRTSPGIVDDLPPTPGGIVLKRGDRLMVTAGDEPGQPVRVDAHGETLAPARIGITGPSIFDELEPGHHLWFGGGRLGAVVRAARGDSADLEVVHAAAAGSALEAGKRLKLPDTVLPIPALTEADLAHLDFVAAHADIVSGAFMRSADDVIRLQAELARRDAASLGVVVTIDSRQGVEQLPHLLLAAMRSPRCGVAVMRSDLAVECGNERMSDVEDDILHLCDAAHLPVVWATRVLATLAKTGTPSRAEFNDAAISDGAAVMLDRGPYVLDALRLVDEILQRRHSRYARRRSLVRPVGKAPTSLG